MEQKWYFPKDNGGDEKGFEDQGTNHFKSSPYGKLAREIIQNSYDAKKEGEEKVIVKFQLLRVPKEKIMGVDFILKSLGACCDYFSENEKLKKFYERASKDLEEEYINVLKISDYNTTGLNGITERKGSSWYGLVKSTGNSTKKGISGGSYGSGKHAPFVFSNLRTIFYGTYVEDEGFAFQGKSLLCAHKMDGELKTNVGFYGNVIDKCYPIRTSDEVDEIYRRNVPGTDVYIVDCNMKKTFSDDGEIEWYENISLSIVENFWKIILEGKLEVEIYDNDNEVFSISKNNIKDLAEYLENTGNKIDDEEDFTANKFLKVNDEDIDFSYGSICEENDVRIKIMKLSDSLEKKILYFRNTEMKIKVKEIRKKQIGFYAIFEAFGDEISKVLRDTEPQTHDDWNPNNVEDDAEKKYASKCIREIDKWIMSQIDDLLFVEDVEELEVEGLDSFIIDDENDSNDNEEDESIFNNRKNKNQEIEKIVDKTPKKKKQKIEEANDESELTDGGEEPGGDDFGGEGDQPTDINPNPNPSPNPNPDPDYDVNYTDHNTAGNEYHIIEVPFIGTPYDSKTNTQKIIIKSNDGEVLTNVKIALFKIVDSGDYEKLLIKSAYSKTNELSVNKNEISNITVDGSTCIDVKLEDSKKYIMEVKVYVQN